MWKGRQGPWFAAEGLYQLYYSIENGTSKRFQEMLDRIPPANVSARDQLLGFQQQLKTKLLETLQSKLYFWTKIPWKALAIFYSELGGDLQASRRCCGECLLEYDEAVAMNPDRVHRVATLLFGRGQAHRADFEAYANGERTRLKDFPTIYLLLEKYALSSLVERRIEQVHSRLKTAGKQMAHVEPPYLCALLREAGNLNLLRTNQAFFDMVKAQWRSQALLFNVLQTRFTREELAQMSKTERIKRIYQCSLADEYADMTEHRQLASTVLAATASSREEKPPGLPPDIQQSVVYLKAHFWQNGFFGLPQAFFDRGRAQFDSTLLELLQRAHPLRDLEASS